MVVRRIEIWQYDGRPRLFPLLHFQLNAGQLRHAHVGQLPMSGHRSGRDVPVRERIGLLPEKRGDEWSCRVPFHVAMVRCETATPSAKELTSVHTPCRSPSASNLNWPVNPSIIGSERRCDTTTLPSATF
eukprot:3659496-Prymnesium_polylepis.1